MAAQMLALVNPAKRKRKSKSAARTTRRRAKNKGQHVAGYYPNPAPRRHHRRRKSASGVSVRRFHRNPIAGRRRGGIVKGIVGTVKNGAVGAVGGLLTDAAMKFAPLSMKTGAISHLIRGSVAVALGLVGDMVRIPGAGMMAEGAMTITLYQAAREYITVPMGLAEYTEADMAGLGLAGLGNYGGALPGGGVGSVAEYTDQPIYMS